MNSLPQRGEASRRRLKLLLVFVAALSIVSATAWFVSQPDEPSGERDRVARPYIGPQMPPPEDQSSEADSGAVAVSAPAGLAKEPDEADRPDLGLPDKAPRAAALPLPQEPSAPKPVRAVTGQALSAASALRGEAQQEDADEEESDEAPTGTLEREAITEVISKMRPAVKGCYEELLGAFPDASGVIRLSFTIVAVEGVSHIDLEQASPDSTLYDETLQQCLLDALRSQQFPLPQGGDGSVKVTYPFRFASGQDEP